MAFFFNAPAATAIYPLSLHDALPICQVILVERDKLVPRLGSRGRLPVEVVPFALPLCRRRLAALGLGPALRTAGERPFVTDRKSTRLNSSHVSISYAVFCLKKKTTHT